MQLPPDHLVAGPGVAADGDVFEIDLLALGNFKINING
jgi:hypothetical protein